MCARTLLALALACASSPPAAAQPQTVADVRVITNERLGRLSYIVHNSSGKKVFTSEELRSRLTTVPPTDAILVTKAQPGDADTVWYTDVATPRPKPMTATRAEHDFLIDFTDGGVARVMNMNAGPRTFTEFVVATAGGKDVKVPVTKTVMVVPSDADVKAALDDIAKVSNPDVRAALELAAGAKFADLFPPATTLPAPKPAVALADKYRKAVYDDAVKAYAAKPEGQLPTLNDPTPYGVTTFDPLSVARAVQGAVPDAIFETPTGKFAAVWDKSTLVLVRQPKGMVFGATTRLKVSDAWLDALDPKIKHPTFFPSNKVPVADLLKPIELKNPGGQR